MDYKHTDYHEHIWQAKMVCGLRKRRGFVVIGGQKSRAMRLRNMVFQGAVWGLLVFRGDLWEPAGLASLG